ncbi:MmsAB operon regulatory protein [Pseudomonas knackmussii B13]|uniref:MmsAB operon regulatory protein n=1 Tax=Pseudomonas knackmussii (strain DSM 6978 / CCUG 54928 / LMG 23759 / B13) TaxID=1301098 RepID=A0A024HM94_PSEKB|nr:AraC family transcriptional regulator [Pseudomonas knackmussii]CDF86160.1 MmsAB operon regulatory protein [Pseudomonas knackmussii B13]
MSRTSDWPLPPDSLRLLLPPVLLAKLAAHPLSRDLYPTSLGHYRRARDHQMSRDRHDDHLLIYCSEGVGHLLADTTEGPQALRVGSGDLIWLPPGMAHEYRADHEQPWSISWVHLRGDGAHWLRQAAGYDASPLRHWGVQHALLGGFTQLLEAGHSGYRFQPYLLAASRLRALLCQLPLLRPLREGGLDLDGLHAYMRENLHRRLELAQLAAFCNLSKFHFVNRYRVLTGRTPVQHFLHLKIEYACQLLDSSGHSVAQVSEALGYDDSYYFSRLFSKVMGLSPSAYRARLGEGRGGA